MRFRLVKARRFWAVYDGDTLVCITVYKKGACSVIDRLTQLSRDNSSDVRKDTAHESGDHAPVP